MAEINADSSVTLEQQLGELFQRTLPERVNSNEHLVWRGRYLTADIAVHIGSTAFLVRFEKGRVIECRKGVPLLWSTAFAIKGSAKAWAAFWENPPKPGWHDIFAMHKQKEMSLEGNLYPLMCNLGYMKDVLSLPRKRKPGSRPAQEPPAAALNQVEPIVGRYMTIRIMNDDCRIYFEEAGQGSIPLVCLHTAGTDCRQFRHILNDPEILKNYKVFAFDYPWHGKSNPPAGFHNYQYQFTLERYIETIRAFCHVLHLDRPVIMGCSIGGRVVLPLAASYGKEFRAFIGIESALETVRWIDDLSYMYRPDVNAGEYCGAHESGLVSPTSPEQYRQETLWMYMQGGPGVLIGDLFMYREPMQLGKIDTTATPLYMLNGEYDYSCTPEDSMRTAAKIPGAKLTIMKGMGHFPMSEDPVQFRQYILPVLKEIYEKETARASAGKLGTSA
jgi:pimeloyl-ACP methyl ester carboxylesterase